MNSKADILCVATRQINHQFPDVDFALTEPDGLLAAGGDLSVERLLQAYRMGIFPWFDQDQPILWWSPDPRMVLFPDQIHISKSLSRVLRSKKFKITFDQAFSDVILACAGNRKNASGTWLCQEMISAYIALHNAGHAHSVECWENDRLVGGLYGVSLGKIFFGESMFSRVSNASKACLVWLAEHLQQNNYQLIDCQMKTDHLQSMGATEISRQAFSEQLKLAVNDNTGVSAWP